MHAEIQQYNAAAEVDATALRRWLAQAPEVQWDYRNVVSRKGKLERIT